MLDHKKMAKIASLMDEATRLAQEDGYTLGIVLDPDTGATFGISVTWGVAVDDSHGEVFITPNHAPNRMMFGELVTSEGADK